MLDTVWETKVLSNKCSKAKFKSLWKQYQTNWNRHMYVYMGATEMSTVLLHFHSSTDSINYIWLGTEDQTLSNFSCAALCHSILNNQLWI